MGYSDEFPDEIAVLEPDLNVVRSVHHRHGHCAQAYAIESANGFSMQATEIVVYERGLGWCNEGWLIDVQIGGDKLLTAYTLPNGFEAPSSQIKDLITSAFHVHAKMPQDFQDTLITTDTIDGLWKEIRTAERHARPAHEMK